MTLKKKRQSGSIKNPLLYWIIISLVVGAMLGYEFAKNPDSKLFKGIGLNQEPARVDTVLPKNVELCFTPPSGCAAVIEKQISQALSSICAPSMV